MEDDSRARKKGFFGGPLNRGRGFPLREDMGMYNRRTLNGPDLKPPKYTIKPQYIIEDNIEKLVKYAGCIQDVASDMDITNRTDVLRVVDLGKKEGDIPLKMGIENDAIFSLSVFQIKISRYTQTEELLLRTPMHEVAAACYIKDDRHHILALKHGTPEVCKLTILYCDTRQGAEELCALIDQCFRLIYTEVTMEIFDKVLPPTSISEGSITPNFPASIPPLMTMPQFVTRSEADLPNGRGTHSRRLGSKRDSGSSTRDSDSIHADLIKDYMKRLQEDLSADERQQFAKLLDEWEKEGLTLADFCTQVLLLYGQDKKHLLADMSPFIPSANYEQFLEILRENSIQVPDSGTMSSIRSYRRVYARSVSELSTTSTLSNGGSDFVEQLLNLVTQDIERLDASIDVDINPAKFMPLDYDTVPSTDYM